jgi:hypothetical protein
MKSTFRLRRNALRYAKYISIEAKSFAPCKVHFNFGETLCVMQRAAKPFALCNEHFNLQDSLCAMQRTCPCWLEPRNGLHYANYVPILALGYYADPPAPSRPHNRYALLKEWLVGGTSVNTYFDVEVPCLTGMIRLYNNLLLYNNMTVPLPVTYPYSNDIIIT